MEVSLYELKALLCGDKPSRPFFVVGKAYIVQTVTHYYTGRCTAFVDHGIELSDAAWIADTGRWSEALTKGTLNEIEPMPSAVFIGIGAVVSATEWMFELPRVKK